VSVFKTGLIQLYYKVCIEMVLITFFSSRISLKIIRTYSK